MPDWHGGDVYSQCQADGKSLFSQAVRADFNCTVKADSFWHTGGFVFYPVFVERMGRKRDTPGVDRSFDTVSYTGNNGAGNGVRHHCCFTDHEIPGFGGFDQFRPPDLDVHNTGSVSAFPNSGEMARDHDAEPDGAGGGVVSPYLVRDRGYTRRISGSQCVRDLGYTDYRRGVIQESAAVIYGYNLVRQTEEER